MTRYGRQDGLFGVDCDTDLTVRDSNPGREAIFFFSAKPLLTLGPSLPLTEYVPGYFPEVKRPGCVVNYSCIYYRGWECAELYSSSWPELVELHVMAWHDTHVLEPKLLSVHSTFSAPYGARVFRPVAQLTTECRHSVAAIKNLFHTFW